MDRAVFQPLSTSLARVCVRVYPLVSVRGPPPGTGRVGWECALRVTPACLTCTQRSQRTPGWCGPSTAWASKQGGWFPCPVCVPRQPPPPPARFESLAGFAGHRLDSKLISYIKSICRVLQRLTVWHPRCRCLIAFDTPGTLSLLTPGALPPDSTQRRCSAWKPC